MVPVFESIFSRTSLDARPQNFLKSEPEIYTAYLSSGASKIQFSLALQLQFTNSTSPGQLGKHQCRALVCKEPMYRARHWCLPHCPGQVEFVNYSCGAGENCILLAPLGKYALYISGVLLRMWASFMVWHPSLSLKICFHMPEPCSTGF